MKLLTELRIYKTWINPGRLNIIKTGLFFTFLLLLSCESKQEKDPTLFIIGDSTVKNGQGDGSDGLWGWGDFLTPYFDTSRIDIENHAIGGRSSRSFLTEGRWDKVMESLSPGDFVLIQLGHNDGGPYTTGRARASIKGTGEESVEVIMERDSSLEVVHTYGWYIRKYVTDTKKAGGIPLVLSPVPRNMWDENGQVRRAKFDYGLWSKQVASEEDAYFVDLNEIISLKYEELGQEKVKAYFPSDHTHTNLDGAKLNALLVVEGIRMIPECKLNLLLKPQAEE